jgi:metal-sulfur cluster biosynthetic enzyme
MDPDFGMNIVECGFVKDLAVDGQAGKVQFRLELTTPACPIKDEFEKQANQVVEALPWVNEVRIVVCQLTQQCVPRQRWHSVTHHLRPQPTRSHQKPPRATTSHLTSPQASKRRFFHRTPRCR